MEEIEYTPSNLEISKRRQYSGFVIPLTIFLALMVKFPLRIVLNELLYDLLFYGIIVILCCALAVKVRRQFVKSGNRLVAILILCILLSSWQIFDLFIVRMGKPPIASGFYPTIDPSLKKNEGFGWYVLRFPNENVVSHSLYERYYGNRYLAITIKINRQATWFACGG